VKFVLRIALRYFFSKSRQTIINRITVFALVVMIVATAALFIVLSGFAGLKEFSLSFTNAFDPDFRVQPQTGKYFKVDSLMLKKLEALPGVEAVAPEIEEKVLLSYAGKSNVAYLKGVSEEYTNVIPADSLILLGNWISPKDPGIVVGYGIAAKMGMGTYDYANPVEITVPRVGSSSAVFRQAFKSTTTYAVGLFQVTKELDLKYVFASEQLVQNLLSLEDDTFSRIVIKSNLEFLDDNFKKQIQALLEVPITIESREEFNVAFYRMMNSEQLAVYFIFTLVMVISLFNVVGALIMIFLDKRRQMKIVLAMGATHTHLQSVFFMVGLLISGIGGLVGLLLGIILVALQHHFPFIFVPGTPFPYPVSFLLKNVFIVLITLLLLGVIASAWATRGMGKKIQHYRAA